MGRWVVVVVRSWIRRGVCCEFARTSERASDLASFVESYEVLIGLLEET